MYALEPIESGTIIDRHEEQPHVLVSEKQVRKNWNAEQQRWFSEYAYPLNDDVFVSWSPNPEEWKAHQSFMRSECLAGGFGHGGAPANRSGRRDNDGLRDRL
jgi:hypothetical protein